MSFTPSQLEFITASGHCVALAGPGSGKTTSLIEKIVRTLEQPGTKIIAATFTRDAADEMTKRLTKRIGKDKLESDRITINTWHSLALNHRKKNNLSGRVLSPAHQSHLLKRVLASTLSPEEVFVAIQEFEGIKCSMDTDFNQVEHTWFATYQNELRTLNAIDLYDAVRETALQISQKRIPPFDATHLIVDETQDNDEVQFFLADIHAGFNIITSMVGDDDQCIYEWRRARGYEGMKAFAEKRHAKVVTMGDNFRSFKAIVDSADRLISHNNGFRIPKTFVARRGVGGSVQTNATGSTEASAQAIVEGIHGWAQEVATEGLARFQVPSNSVAILARNNYLLDSAEAALIETQIKYVRSGGSIWESEPADLLMTLLATMVSHDSRGLDVALQVAGLPHTIISAINQKFSGNVEAFISGQTKISGFGSYDDAIQQFSSRLGVLKQKAIRKENASLIGSVAALIKNVYATNSQRNIRNRNILRSVATGLIAIKGPLVHRLKTARTTDHKSDSDNAVVLQTFHGSKGLEFENVFLLGVDEDVIPGDSEIRAERRLLYVACTRAKKNLVLTYTPGRASQFIAEL